MKFLNSLRAFPGSQHVPLQSFAEGLKHEISTWNSRKISHIGVRLGINEMVDLLEPKQKKSELCKLCKILEWDDFKSQQKRGKWNIW